MDPFNSNGNQYENKSTQEAMGVWEKGLTPKTLSLLDVRYQSAQPRYVPIAASLPASSIGSPDTSSNMSSPSESWFSENVKAAQSPSTAPQTVLHATAPTRKRIALYDSEQVAQVPDPMRLFYGTSSTHPRFSTSTKKFAQAAASAELTLPTRGTYTTCSDAQVNHLYGMCSSYPGLLQGVLNSLPVVHGTPIGSLGGTSAASSTAMNSGLNVGVNNWTSGVGGTTPEFGFDPLSGTGFVNRITLPNTVSLTFSGTSSAPSHQSPGGPQANTTPTNWSDVFGPPLNMPISPYDLHPNLFPTNDKLEKYRKFLLDARLQAELHCHANRKRRTTEIYHQLLGEAKRNELSCRLYQDQMIGTLGTLFNSNKSPQGVPQPVPIRITDPKKMFYDYNTKQGVKNTKGSWKNLEENNPTEYHSWCKKAIQIDQEQLKQLLKGFIRQGSAYSYAKKNNWLKE